MKAVDLVVGTWELNLAKSKIINDANDIQLCDADLHGGPRGHQYHNHCNQA